MFQLWDEESANLLGSYSTEDAALSIVRDVVEKHGLSKRSTTFASP